MRSYRNHLKEISRSFKDPARVDLTVLKNIVNFLKILKWQHELARYYKRGKLVSYFLHNAAKTCLYWLKISENIEIGHFFQSKTFFHLSSNLHTSCLSVFKKLKNVLSLFFGYLYENGTEGASFRDKCLFKRILNTAGIYYYLILEWVHLKESKGYIWKNCNVPCAISCRGSFIIEFYW